MTIRRATIWPPFLFSALAPKPAAAQDKVRIGVTNSNMVFLNARVALVMGFLQEEGIQTEVIRMNPAVMITAASTGDIDNPLVFGSVARATIRGLPLRITSNLNGPCTCWWRAANSKPSRNSRAGPSASIATARRRGADGVGTRQRETRRRDRRFDDESGQARWRHPGERFATGDRSARNEPKLSREIAPAEVTDMSLLNRAQKELGLR